MYTKTHEVMLAKEIKKLKKDIHELQELVGKLLKFKIETEYDIKDIRAFVIMD